MGMGAKRKMGCAKRKEGKAGNRRFDSGIGLGICLNSPVSEQNVETPNNVGGEFSER